MMLLLLLLVGSVHATPYFRFEPGNDVRTTAVFPLAGNTDGIGFGSATAVLRHHAEDGYLFLPGISWDLLDVGAVKDAAGWKAVFGPSVDLSEPVKAYLLEGLNLFTKENYSALRWALRPQAKSDKSWQLDLGPSLELDTADGQHLRRVRGSFVWHVGGVVRF